VSRAASKRFRFGRNIDGEGKRFRTERKKIHFASLKRKESFRLNTCGSSPTIKFLSTGEVNILNRNIALDLPLGERDDHAKVGCTGFYRIQMHKEQTNKHSSVYIRYIIYLFLFCTLFIILFIVNSLYIQSHPHPHPQEVVAANYESM
jgi:hypothetical protein